MSHGTMSQENNSVTVTTRNNKKLGTMSLTMTTSALVTFDVITPIDMGGNITLRSRMDLLIH
jgi:hypothetical protein